MGEFDWGVRYVIIFQYIKFWIRLAAASHRSITPKFVTPTALSCIDDSWRSTTLESAEETYLFNS